MKNNFNKVCIITTINPLNNAIRKFQKFDDYNMIIVGDKKTPKYNENNLTFLNIKKQNKLNFKFIKKCPFNSYQRKNIGYLYAMSKGAEIIAETDDDNIPLSNWGSNIDFFKKSISKITSPKICNIYSLYSDENVWPRGYPLENINSKEKIKIKNTSNKKVGVWNGLADKEPDVDAIFRLVDGKQIKFKNKKSVILSKNVFCPFNSQNTFWTKEFFPYLYLPISVSFRFTDILRGYVAQRCLWEHNAHLGFMSPTVYQNRNKHDLMKDFSDELSCYTDIKNVIDILSRLKLGKNPSRNLVKIYSEFQKYGIVKREEITGVKYWLDDIASLLRKS
tara:strand:+ start:3010 stop:4011 length:1002 start_codon:yes stop_codon:yes gene_type:complete